MLCVHPFRVVQILNHFGSLVLEAYSSIFLLHDNHSLFEVLKDIPVAILGKLCLYVVEAHPVDQHEVQQVVAEAVAYLESEIA